MGSLRDTRMEETHQGSISMMEDTHKGNISKMETREARTSCFTKVPVLGVKIAPVNVPISRRLQTFSVLFWMSYFLFSGLIGTGITLSLLPLLHLLGLRHHEQRRKEGMDSKMDQRMAT